MDFRDYERSLQDVLSQFFREAAENLPGQETEELLLVRSLVKLFPDARIVVVWRESARDFGFGAIYEEEDGLARCLSAEEVKKFFELTADVAQRGEGVLVSNLYVRPVAAEDGHPLALGLGRPHESTAQGENPERACDELWIILPDSLDAEGIETFGWLPDYRRGLNDLFTAFWSLKRSTRYSIILEETNIHQRLKGRLDRLVADSGLTTSECLRKARFLLDHTSLDLTSPLFRRNLELVRELATWTMQEVLGEGWDLQIPLGGTRQERIREGVGEYKALDEFIEKVEDKIEISLEEYNPSLEEYNSKERGLLEEIGDIRDILEASVAVKVEGPARVVSRKGRPRTGSGKASPVRLRRLTKDDLEVIRDVPEGVWGLKERVLTELGRRLMVVWSRVHQISRGLSISSPPKEKSEKLLPQKLWLRAVSYSLPLVAEILRRLYENRNPGMRSRVYAWLRLWFCYRILLHVNESSMREEVRILESERWRFRADLAYVVRETLRSLIFSERRDFRFQPTNYAGSLMTLVEAHAQRVVKLPREFDLRFLLQEIGDPRRVDDYLFAAGHVQHALETYIAGHFLCSLKVPSKRASAAEKGTVAEILVGSADLPPGEQAVDEFLQAFSLTALFHDIGLLLFPRDLMPQDAFFRGDQDLMVSMSRVRGDLKVSAGALLERCRDELADAEYFDANEEPDLNRWIDRVIQTGEPDHSLLGAWYLHRVFQSVTGASSEVLRYTIRAVLLHGVTTQEIFLERDPVASLMVLCDELFEWDPYQEGGPRGVTSSHSLQSIAVDLRPRIPRAKELRLRGLEVKTGKSRILECSLKPPAEEGQRWPAFEISLQEPRLLQKPVHFIWLSMAQNLGRVHQETGHWWSPSVRVHSRVPERLRAVRINTKGLLDLVVEHSRLPIRPRLNLWLTEEKMRFGPLKEDREKEWIVLEVLAQALHTEPVDHSFQVLEADIERIIREVEGRSHGLLDQFRSSI